MESGWHMGSNENPADVSFHDQSRAQIVDWARTADMVFIVARKFDGETLCAMVSELPSVIPDEVARVLIVDFLLEAVSDASNAARQKYLEGVEDLGT